jgi:hypothetical protein
MLVNWWMSHGPNRAPAEPPGAGTRPVKRVGRSGAVVVHPTTTRSGPVQYPGGTLKRADPVRQVVRRAGGLIHPSMDINTMAGSHVDEVVQACAVSRYLVRVVRLDRGEDALLGHGDLYLQLLTHVGHLLPRTRRRRDGETGYVNDGPAKRCPACRHRRPGPRPQDLRQLRCADDSVTAVAAARIPRDQSDRADAGPHLSGDRRPGPGLRVLAKFVENGVWVVRSRAGRRPRRSRPGRPDRDEHAGRRARRAARDGDRGRRVRPGAGATLRRGAARVCVIAAGSNDSTASGSSRRGGTPGAASGIERAERALPDSSAISTPPGRRASAHQEHPGCRRWRRRRAPECSRTAAAWTPPVAALAAQAATFSALRVTTALPQAVAAAAGSARPGRAGPHRQGRARHLLGLGREAEGHRHRGAARCDRRHRSSAQTPDRWTVVAKMLPQR